MIYYVVQLECRALHFSVDFIDETNQHGRTHAHVHKINEQRINRQIELIHHIIDAKQLQIGAPAPTYSLLLMNENNSVREWQIKGGIRDEFIECIESIHSK